MVQRISRSRSVTSYPTSSLQFSRSRSVANLSVRNPMPSSCSSQSPSFGSYLGVTDRARYWGLYDPYYYGTYILRYPRASYMYYGFSSWPLTTYHSPLSRKLYRSNYSAYKRYFDKYLNSHIRDTKAPFSYSYIDSKPFYSNYWVTRLAPQPYQFYPTTSIFTY